MVEYILIGIMFVIIIVRGIIWEERKERLYLRIEKLEIDVETLKEKLKEGRK